MFKLGGVSLISLTLTNPSMDRSIESVGDVGRSDKDYIFYRICATRLLLTVISLTAEQFFMGDSMSKGCSSLTSFGGEDW